MMWDPFGVLYRAKELVRVTRGVAPGYNVGPLWGPEVRRHGLKCGTLSGSGSLPALGPLLYPPRPPGPRSHHHRPGPGLAEDPPPASQPGRKTGARLLFASDGEFERALHNCPQAGEKLNCQRPALLLRGRFGNFGAGGGLGFSRGHRGMADLGDIPAFPEPAAPLGVVKRFP